MKKKSKRSKRGTFSIEADQARWTGAVLPSPTGIHVELICEYLERPHLPKVHVLVRHEDVVHLVDSIREAMDPLPNLNS